MNKYQRKIHKQVKSIIFQELKEIDEKYPVIKKSLRNVRHLLETIDIKSNKHYRQIRFKVKTMIFNKNIY